MNRDAQSPAADRSDRPAQDEFVYASPNSRRPGKFRGSIDDFEKKVLQPSINKESAQEAGVRPVRG